MTLFGLVGDEGHVTGIDASRDMIAEARALNKPAFEGPSPRKFVLRDGHNPVPVGEVGAYDKVFSNAALHWMKRDPALVLQNVFSYLRPGGRFAAELGGFMNCVGIRGHLHHALSRRGIRPEEYDPWFFPTPSQYNALLEKVGFRVESCELVPRITPLPKESGLHGWLRTFAGPFLNAIEDAQEKEAVVNEVLEAVKPDCYDAETGIWSVMYVRLRVLAFKPE